MDLCLFDVNFNSAVKTSAMSAAANEVSNEEPVGLISTADNEEDVHRAAVAGEVLTRISSSLRRRACDACRARKVRCDRQDPPCNRCVRMGVACHYSGRGKPTNSRIGMSRFLETLNNRLSECWLDRGSGRDKEFEEH